MRLPPYKHLVIDGVWRQKNVEVRQNRTKRAQPGHDREQPGHDRELLFQGSAVDEQMMNSHALGRYKSEKLTTAFPFSSLSNEGLHLARTRHRSFDAICAAINKLSSRRGQQHIPWYSRGVKLLVSVAVLAEVKFIFNQQETFHSVGVMATGG
ncbi:unnamed protein product [Clavelina lepadiformis]|uniref:Uncharacterized protein n=1 Tax=Clavelina lepadiformis TaxID=159417 RepID=A0ABP0EZQ0_CLALP